MLTCVVVVVTADNVAWFWKVVGGWRKAIKRHSNDRYDRQAHENIRKINTHENGYKIKNGAYIICLFV